MKSNINNGGEASSFASELHSLQEANPQVKRTAARRCFVPDISPEASYEDKEEAFKRALEELSSMQAESSLDDKEVSKFAKFFSDLYGGAGFRHRYAVICEVMYSSLGASKNLDRGVPFCVRSLSNNVELIYRHMSESGNYESAVDRVLKLNDHIELEVTRMEYLKEQNTAITDMKSDLEEELATSKDNFQKETMRIRDEIQKSSITILGIFAAVVMVFNGSINLFASSLSATSVAPSASNVVLIVIIVGFILFNTVIVLLNFLTRINSDGNNESSFISPAWHVILMDVILIIAAVTITAFDKCA